METRLKGGFCPQGSEKPRRALCWTQVTSACARRFPQAAGRTWGGASWSGQGEPLVAVSSGRRGGLDSGGVAMGAVQSPPARSPLLALPCRRPGPPSVPALLTPHVLGSVLCPALSPWRAGVTSGHCSPRGCRRGFDERWSSGRKAVAWWRGLGVLRMALRGPALLGCWDPLRSSHRSSPWRLWAGAEVVLTGGAEVTTRNPQRLWMRAGVLTRAALWPSPSSPGLARTSSRLCASALATPRRPPSAALRTAVSKSGREPQSLRGDNQVDVGGMTAKPPSPRRRGHLTSGWGVRSFRTQPDTPWGVGEESREKLVVVKTEAYGSG